MKTMEVNILFFTLFETYALKNKIYYPYKNESINTSSTLYNTWEMTNGKIHKSVCNTPYPQNTPKRNRFAYLTKNSHPHLEKGK